MNGKYPKKAFVQNEESDDYFVSRKFFDSMRPLSAKVTDVFRQVESKNTWRKGTKRFSPHSFQKTDNSHRSVVNERKVQIPEYKSRVLLLDAEPEVKDV